MNIKDLLKDAYKEGMSVEDIEKALASIDLPNDGSAEIEKLKAALSKSNSEAADYKKQLREKMSADEIKAKEEADKMEELQSKYDALLKESTISKYKARFLALLKESTISKYKARFLALGYDEALATETAEAMANGDTEKVFAAQQKHLDAVDKKIREEVLKDTPRPTGGSGSETITKETFSKMSLAEQYKYSKEHPEEYKTLYGGN